MFSVSQLQRNILASNPRVTRFHINWEGLADKVEDSENVDPSPNVSDMFSPSCIPAKLGGVLAGRLMPDNSMDCMWGWSVCLDYREQWTLIHRRMVCRILFKFGYPLPYTHDDTVGVLLGFCRGWANNPPALILSVITLNLLDISYFLVIRPPCVQLWCVQAGRVIYIYCK